MSRNPTDLYERLLKALKAWSVLRPNKSFGYTLDAFKAEVAPSLELREQLEKAEAHRQSLIARRDDADVRTRKALRRVIHTVIADPEEGEDGELYREMGYMPRTVRSVLQSVSRVKNAEKAAALPAPDKEVVS